MQVGAHVKAYPKYHLRPFVVAKVLLPCPPAGEGVLGLQPAIGETRKNKYIYIYIYIWVLASPRKKEKNEPKTRNMPPPPQKNPISEQFSFFCRYFFRVVWGRTNQYFSEFFPTSARKAPSSRRTGFATKVLYFPFRDRKDILENKKSRAAMVEPPT